MNKTENKFSIVVLTVILSIVIFIVGVLSGILILLNSDNYFESRFIKYDVVKNTGIELDDLMIVNNDVREFLLGRRDDLVVYTEIDEEIGLVFKEDEQSHMNDVKNLLLTFLPIYYICIALLMVSGYFGVRKSSKTVLKSLKYSSVGALIIPVIFVSFFDEMFVVFHEIFFPQGNWMFSLRTSLMVNIYTEDFFLNFCINLAVILLALCIAVFTLSKIKLKKVNEVK